MICVMSSLSGIYELNWLDRSIFCLMIGRSVTFGGKMILMIVATVKARFKNRLRSLPPRLTTNLNYREERSSSLRTPNN